MTEESAVALQPEGVVPQKFAIKLSYRGTRYCGWQTQKGWECDELPAIQTTIIQALKKITGEEVSVVGSGRTDSGVHALGQVAHFILKRKEWNPEHLRRGLNSVLRPRIQVIWVKKVPMDFHAQRSAIKKQYSYYFQQGPCALPHLEPYSWWIYKNLDIAAMNEALGHLRGEHDFKPFQARGAKPGQTVRTILEAEAVFEPIQFPGHGDGFGFVRVRLMGTGFLKQMVRGIAGTLLEVGDGRRHASCTQEILERMDRQLVGTTAPARALWLERVWYPESFQMD